MFLGEDQLATLLHVVPQEEKISWDLFLKVNLDAEGVKRRGFISYVDCTNIVLCQQHRIQRIATPDGHYHGWLEYP